MTSPLAVLDVFGLSQMSLLSVSLVEIHHLSPCNVKKKEKKKHDSHIISIEMNRALFRRSKL